MSFDNIPQELRQLPQWCNWKYEDVGAAKPTKVPYNPATGQRASHSDPLTWNPFELCVEAVRRGLYSGIGFVLSDRDPYAFIDLDDTHDDTQAAQRQQAVFEAFRSYSEKSPSGKGLHIIVKGSVPNGRKRAHIEVYSSLRFMTMTGDVFFNAPIEDRNDLLNDLWGQMGGSAVASTYQGDPEQKLSDQEVLNRAGSAANGGKFIDLWNGGWSGMYSSQSEADFALVDILAFYTENVEQIVRLFRMSALGQRPKAQRSDYVNYMVRKAFDRKLPPIDFDALKNQMEDALARARQKPVVNPFEQQEHRAPQEVFAPNNHTMFPALQGVPMPRQGKTEFKRSYERPPGLVGDIANFIYAQAPRQVPEIALAGAIGLMAGICGRAFNVSGMGLNQYVMLLAQTGVGKEAMATGIDKLMTEVKKTVPAAAEFIGPAEIASPEALQKYLNYGSSSFVSLWGEVGLKLKQMSAFNAPPHMVGLRRTLLDLFNKSGQGKTVKATIYSDKAKNTEEILAPAFSILGESTPERFYESLNEAMISEGLVPRLTMIEYTGPRPPMNRDHLSVQPPAPLVQQLVTLCGHSLMLNKQNACINVGFDDRAQTMVDQFDEYCTERINSSDHDVIRQLWNRAHVKAMKLSALLAVGANPYQPIITEALAKWGIDLVLTDTEMLLARFESGKVGGADNNDAKQVEDVHRIIVDYMMNPQVNCSKYGIPMRMFEARVIPIAYLSRRIASLSSFRQDRMGSTNALKKIIQLLIDRGELTELPKFDSINKFGSSGRCFMVSDASAFRFE